jgi:hypothetical protein
LEGGGRICETEEHYLRLKQASIGGERSLPFVARFNTNVVVPPPNIEFGEDAGVLKMIDDIQGQGKGIPILDGKVIQLSVVLDKSESSILFLNEKDRGSDWGFGRDNVAFTQVFLQEPIQFLLFVYSIGIG